MEPNQNLDCGFVRNNNWFRYRVAAIIIENDCVLMASNETAEEAIVREVFEETGIEYEIDRLASAGMLKGLVCHEIAFYFLMKPRGTQELNSNSYCPEGKEFMNWIPISDLKNLKAYPTFFAEKLTNLADTIEHIVTREYSLT